MKTAVLFSGQGETPGTSTIEMWKTDDHARSVWDEASALLDESLWEWIEQGTKGDTRRAQLLSVVGSLATYRAYVSRIGLLPEIILGHSVGEIAALSVACGLTLKTTLRITEARGRAMQSAITANGDMGMAAIIDPPHNFASLVGEHDDVYIANLNSRSQQVISGYSTAIDEFIRDEKLRGIRLDVGGAFHTPLMAEAAESFRLEMESLDLVALPGITIVSNRTAQAYDTTNIVFELAAQVVSPVRWAESMAFSHAHGIQQVVDLSSTGMFSRISDLPGLRFAFGGNLAALEETSSRLRHLREVEESYDLAARALGKVVSTKNHNPDHQAYREVVIPSYQKIRALVGQANVDTEEILDLVDRILTVKCVDDDTRKSAVNNLRWRAGLSASS